MQIFGEKYFENPIEKIIAFDNEGFIKAFPRIEELRKRYYLLGYIRYESKDIFLGKKIKSNLPLLYFECYEEVKSAEIQEYKNPLELSIESQLTYQEYLIAIDKIKQEISNGNTYEVNYTYDWKVSTDLDGVELFNSILPRQKTPYNAYIKNEYEEILSFSPELFFELEGNKIHTKPMKGTIKRGKTEQEDVRNIEFLKNDEKNRAENVMIVDLLRNDLGKIAKTGSVKVDKLFEIETHPTLHQMTSEISAELEENITLFDVFEAIFPCGSITGAPKISTMEIIEKFEIGSRGVYCGAIGLLSPEKTIFSVPIRILQRQKTKINDCACHCEEGQSPDAAIQKANTGLLHCVCNDIKKYTCRVGGAIVWDSTAEEEWEETLTKISFLNNAEVVGRDCYPADIKLVETMLVQDGKIQFLDEHLARMENSAKELGFVFNKEKCLVSLRASKTSAAIQKKDKILRLLLNKQGNFETQILSIDEIKTNKVTISKTPVQNDNKLLYHKTTYRPWYDESMKKIKAGEVFDEIFFNEKGELTEGARSNIILQIGDEFFTPPIKCGLLSGIMRQKLINDLHPHPEFPAFVPHAEIHPSPQLCSPSPQSSPRVERKNNKKEYRWGEGTLLGKIQEKVLYLDDLKNAEKVFCINSVREIIEVQLEVNGTSPLRGEVDFQYEQRRILESRERV